MAFEPRKKGMTRPDHTGFEPIKKNDTEEQQLVKPSIISIKLIDGSRIKQHFVWASPDEDQD